MKLIIFNQDLRIFDHPALFFACQKSQLDNQEILPIFILDQVNQRNIGGASKWFLHFALEQLQKDLQEKLGLELLVFEGDSLQILTKIFSQVAVQEIYFNRLYEPDSMKLQAEIKNLAVDKNIQVFDFKSYLLFEPEEIKNGSGTYFKVFTPFWKNCLKSWELVSEPLSIPTKPSSQRKLGSQDACRDPSLRWDDDVCRWAKKFENLWHFDRKTIVKNFQHFLKNHLKDYKENRNFPTLSATSKLSPYLHFGLISVSEIVNLVKEHHLKNPEDKAGTAHFLSEIGWREFSYHLLFHFPELPQKNFKTQFDNFAWDNKAEQLKKWQKGQTGYPIIDAAMQELWQTGFMQNRCRMIVASFLIKDLFIDWRIGEEWFWDCLVDANLANNVASWQWVAGSGADAAPYFRIFNPVLQSEKFDPDGEYIKKYLPVLKNLPAKFIHQPWQLSEMELLAYGVKLGKNYPERIVRHEDARNKALALYKKL
ncbi:MAG: deoxyribodipyrimidine photo-lyase [Pseudomonadota bacterium]